MGKGEAEDVEDQWSEHRGLYCCLPGDLGSSGSSGCMVPANWSGLLHHSASGCFWNVGSSNRSGSSAGRSFLRAWANIHDPVISWGTEAEKCIFLPPGRKGEVPKLSSVCVITLTMSYCLSQQVPCSWTWAEQDFILIGLFHAPNVRPQSGIWFQVSVPKILYSCKTWLGVLCSALQSSAQGGYGPVGENPEETTRMLRGLDDLFLEERPRELGLFILDMRTLWEDLAVACQYLKGACKKNEERFFSRQGLL